MSETRRQQLLSSARRARGFMPDDEGLALFEAGLEAGRRRPGGSLLEVGAWCGKSAVYLGAAAEETGSVLFSLDHHHGSEENQAGWEHFDAEGFLAAIEQQRVTHAQVVPTMFVRLLALPEELRARYDLNSLRCVFHAAAPCPVPVKREMMAWLGPIIYEYYSGTEGAGMTFCTPEDWLAHPGTVGRPMFSELHIVGDEGEELPAGQEGLVYFAGLGTFEYLNDPEKTRASHHQQGWATYGDIGRVDEEGFLFLTDRRADLIIVGGVNVYPQEAENLLISHPVVLDAAVFGVPQLEFGEEVKAVVQLVPGIEPSAELELELISFCQAELAKIKCPRSIDFRSELPREPSGKLLKRKLRDEYRSAGAS